MTETKRTWIFPPALKQVKLQFEALYRSLYKTADRRKPLMIIGDRGVGKSAFVDLFVDLYTADNRAKVKRLNIASLPENLLVSELFGHKKGSFTDARTDKPGHFKTLGDGGLLILEEVGDISPQIQAKLLTVIEDGEYYPVGETDKPEKAKNIQIVGTTNKPRSAFREDFYDRFFRFKIPAIHERRGDIFYYIALNYPQLLLSLQAAQTLSLMSYNWPGNVREIESFCSNIKWREEAQSEFNRDEAYRVSLSIDDMQNPKSLAAEGYLLMMRMEKDDRLKRVLQNLYKMHERLSLTNDGSGFELYPEANAWTETIGEKRVEKIQHDLKKYHLALFDVSGIKKAFNGPTFLNLPNQYALPSNIQGSVIDGDIIKAFSLVYAGFRHFCNLTDQHHRENSNLIIPKKKLLSESEKQTDIYSMKEDDLLREYYGHLLRQSGGNQKEAARRAGIGYGNFRKRLQKYNIVQ